jgi:hypothetical protein
MANESDFDGTKIHAEQLPLSVEEVHHGGSWNILSDLPPVGRVVRSVWKAHRESLLEVRVVHRQDFSSQREENEPVQEDDPKELRRGAPIPIRL